MTGSKSEQSTAVVEAAQWLSDQNPPPSPVVPSLRKRFNLTGQEACEACSHAFEIRAAQESKTMKGSVNGSAD